MTNDFDGVVRVTESLVNQLHSWPISVLIVFILVVIGSWIRTSRTISNRWAPIAIFGLGIGLNVFFGDPGKVHPEQRNPMAMLGLYGFGLGFISLCIYRFAGKWIDQRVRVFEENQTQTYTKNKNNELDSNDQ